MLIGTAVVNVLGLLVIAPLAKRWCQLLINRMQSASAKAPQPGKFLYKPLMGKANYIPVEMAQKQVNHLSRSCFMVLGIIVLGVAGFVFGLFGLVFIGVPLVRGALPGVLAFIAMSFLSMFLAHGSLGRLFM